jgi:hypothetical protein
MRLHLPSSSTKCRGFLALTIQYMDEFFSMACGAWCFEVA